MQFRLQRPCSWFVALLLLGMGVRPSPASEIAWIWPSSDAAPGHFDEVAVLVESLVFRGDTVERTPRSRPLVMPAHARLVPVVHIESRLDAADTFSPAQTTAVLTAFQTHAREATAGLIQLDFEAPARQRPALLDLVRALRKTLPAKTRLSVTVLVSWCAQGDWLDELRADEIVPMLYRLGPDSARWFERFSSKRSSLSSRCLGPALGASVQDPPDAGTLARASRLYWFNERNWSRSSRPGTP